MTRAAVSKSRRVKTVMIFMIILAACAIGAAYLVKKRLAQPIEIKDIAIDTSADLTIVPFDQLSKKDGQLQFELTASSARLTTRQNSATMTDVSIRYYASDMQAIEVSAPRGVLNTKTMDVSFYENVVVDYESARLRTKTLHYKKKEHIIYTESHVTVENQDAFIEADSMKTELNTRTIVLEGRVKGNFSDKIHLF